MKSTIPLVLAMLALTGCLRKDLDRDTATRILQAREFGTVQGSFSAAAGFLRWSGEDAKFQALMQLAQSGVLNCSGDCRPGPNGSALSPGGAGLSFQAGSFVLGAVTGVQKQSDTSAVVQARLDFRPSPFYSQYRGVLDQLANGREGSLQMEAPLSSRTSTQVREFQFRRFDDGWRLQ